MEKTTAHKAYNLIILDESGSMEAIRRSTINGFNELMQSISHEAKDNPSMKQYLSFFSFNGNGIREQVALTEVGDSIPVLDEKCYVPDSMTPLYDAIGHATGKLRIALENERDHAVLVTILTDGAENASKEYTRQTIANIIRQLTSQRWLFTYMGTNQDVASDAARISIDHHFSFDHNDADLGRAMDKERRSRSRYYRDMREGNTEELKKDYFRDDDPAGSEN
jgi:hypothetical protein